jgi:hypothetical protein
MATQQTSTPPKTRRLGIFPDSIRNFVIVIMIVLFVIFGIIGVIGILRGWNTVFNVLFMIFAVISAIFAILTFWQSNNPNEAPASASHKSRRQYRLKSNISLTIGQQDTTQSTSESLVNNVATIETDKQPLTSSGDQVPRGERSVSPLPNTHPTITQASSSPVYSSGFPQRENTGPGTILTHQEQSDLTDALLKVYPNQEDFEMMFERNFERKLNTLVDGTNYRTRVYRLIEWTEAEGRTYNLIRAAHEGRPLNPALQSWLQRYEVDEVTQEAQQITPISPVIAVPPNVGQAIISEPEGQKTGNSFDPGVKKVQESTKTSPDDQPLAKVRRSLSEAQDAVQKSKVIFAGRGDIKQIHYSQAIAALRQLATCTQNLPKLLQSISPFPAYLDRERFIMDLRHISTEVEESIEHIANYDTLSAYQRERNRRDTETRLSSVLIQLDELDRRMMNTGSQ